MPRVHTHYDNLKVSRDAPIEVIHAAFKSLAAKYHPDRNPGNDRAARIMRIINTSYEVLSDPACRRQHDRRIMEAEGPSEPQAEPKRTEPPPRPQPNAEHTKPPKFSSLERRPWLRSVVLLPMAVIVISSVGALMNSGVPIPKQSSPSQEKTVSLDQLTPVASPEALQPHTPDGASQGWSFVDQKEASPRAAPLNAPPTTLRLAYARPTLAPNGEPWPTTSGYLKGYPIGDSGGRSTVTIDNTGNDADMIVKLYDLLIERPAEVRVFFSERVRNSKWPGFDRVGMTSATRTWSRARGGSLSRLTSGPKKGTSKKRTGLFMRPTAPHIL